jgi:putative solute:sodium symporter small subunit
MEDPMSRLTEAQALAYWRRNLALMVKLLLVWFAVSFGCGILFVDVLNQIQIGGYKLGFWFAQQGSIFIFVLLIFYYTRKMAKLDREFNVEED